VIPPNGQGSLPLALVPTPETIQVLQAVGPDAKPRVVLVFFGPNHVDAHHLDGNEAETIGKELVRLAGPTKAGLTVAPRA
jgi:hypothetical protein